MDKKYVVGIDSGTQSTRVIIFDTRGQKVCMGIAAHPPLIAEKAGYAVHDYDDLWNGLCHACDDLFSKFEGDVHEIAAIGLSGQRGTTFFVGEDNRQLCRPISWMDLRWRENASHLPPSTEAMDPWCDYLRNYSRMNWMKTNSPELAGKIHKYLTAPGYMGYQLFGGYVDTLANNLGMPVDREQWALYEDDEVFEKMGLKRSQLARFVEPGQVMGHVTAEAAALTGFPEGCPVVACAGDKQCEVLGSGSISDGQAYITLGTLSGLDIVGEKYIPDAYKKLKHRTYLASVPGTWHAEAAISKGFWLVSWFRDNLAEGLDAKAEKLGMTIEAYLDREAESIPAGSEGLVTIPDWKSNWDKPAAKGMFIGFDHRHKRAHMFRSLIEGIVMQLKVSTDEMCGIIGKSITELRVGGGGSKSVTAVQTIADVFNIPVKKSVETETCSLGCAICAAVGAGIFPDFQQAVEAMGQQTETYTPIAEHHAVYQKLMDRVFSQCYTINEDLLKEIAKITA